MGNFIKIVLGSCLGVIMSILVIGLILTGISASLISASGDTVTIKSNSVLRIDFDKVIPEKTNNSEAALYNFSEEDFVGVHDMVHAIKKAKEDRDIKGIFLSLSAASMGQAKAQYLRSAILDFKESGKFVTAYSGNYGYSQGAYYMATAADEVYLHPLGSVDLRGFGTEIPFFKDMLDRVGVKMNVFYAGKFKGATEPFRLNEMSDENRYQIKTYLQALYDNFVTDISVSRKMSSTAVKKAAETLAGRSAQMALENSLIDAIKYEDEVFSEISDRLDLDEGDVINFVNLPDYFENRGKDKNLSASNKIAVIYAEGEIRAGEETYGTITDEHYVDILRQIRKDKKIDAVVLRVNSPGGDAFVSDEIWREVELIKEKGIPVIASMGNVAASGGYYISCGADKIFAEPNTITGSIGVFGVIPNMQELFNQKLGIHFDTVSTAKYANGVISPFQEVGPDEAAIVQESIDRTYEVFLSRVASGRNMSRDAVHEVAQGRVWTGQQAMDVGLIDEIGSIDDAIAYAASIAELGDEYRISEYPRIKDPMQKLLEDITGQKLTTRIEEKILANRFPETSHLLKELEVILTSKNPMARLPFDVSTY